jgi:hypothetical protein
MSNLDPINRKRRSTHPPANYRLALKIHRALWELAERDGVSRSAALSIAVLEKYRREFGKEPKDEW